MSDQENQETQDSGQRVAEVGQEATATSEDQAVDQQVHGNQASASAPEAPQAGEPAAQVAAAPEGQETVAQAPDEANEKNKDFGQILAEHEQKAPKSQAPAAGQKVKGSIVSIGDEWVFIDLGGKAEGRIAAADLKDAEGNLTVKEGDAIDATVTGTDPESGALLLRRKAGGKGKKPAEVVPEIRQAAESNLPLEGLVTGLNKGGAEVQVYGMRAFCPLSQLDLRYVENPQQFVGQKLMFKVNRLEEGNRGGRGPNIVLSRRQLLEEEQQARAAETREKLQVGAVLHGKVTSLTTYGAFIDLGGIEGMLHVSEIGHTRTTHPQDVFKVGDEVEVQVIKIEKGKDEKRPERISLSRRSLQTDPWNEAASRFSEGMEVPGRVVRTETFGAFVELTPGLEGLVHISEMGAGRRLNHSREAVQPGQEVQVRVLGVDTARRRISLSMNTGANAGMIPMGGGDERREREDHRRRGGGRSDFSRGERGDRRDRDRGDRGDHRSDRGDDEAYARTSATSSGASGFGSMADFFERAKKG